MAESSGRQIKILHVVHAFRPGGMENVIAQVAHRFPAHEVQVAICALTVANEFKTRLPASVEVHELKKRSGLSWEAVLDLRRLIRHLRPDVVHSHNWDGLVYSFFALMGLKSTMLLQGEHAQFTGWEKRPWRLALRRLLYTRCDNVHTVSMGQLTELRALGLDRQSELVGICNGVDTLRFSPQNKGDAKQSLGIPVQNLCIGMVARCIPDKRHGLLLTAFESLAAQFPKLTLVFAGAGGTCEREVRSLIEAHPFRERILWLGQRDDMTGVYNALDLLVLPSKTEGMSNVCLEAMSCGVPALVHQACGVDEVIQPGRNGWTVPLEEAADLVSALQEILPQREMLTRVGTQAREVAEQYRSLNKVVDDYLCVYRSLTKISQGGATL